MSRIGRLFGSMLIFNGRTGKPLPHIAGPFALPLV